MDIILVNENQFQLILIILPLNLKRGENMNRKEILNLDEDKLINSINEKFETNIKNLEDTDFLSEIWNIVENLMEEGWRINIIAEDDLKQVDGILINDGRPETIFAQYGKVPDFDSIAEGICKTALIIKEEKLEKVYK